MITLQRIPYRGAVTAAFVGLVALLLATALVSSTASNTVPPTKARLVTRTRAVSELRPTACAGVPVTALVKGTTKTVTGTSANELVLGGRGAQKLVGNNGRDCLVGGIDANEIDGGSGTDVCIGRQGVIFKNCETTVTW